MVSNCRQFAVLTNYQVIMKENGNRWSSESKSSLLEICRLVTEEDECQCHIGADWLMIWEQNDTELTLLMLSTGTHSDLF